MRNDYTLQTCSVQNARHVKRIAVHPARYLVAPVALNQTKRAFQEL
jgi:hypothetical protein